MITLPLWKIKPSFSNFCANTTKSSSKGFPVTDTTPAKVKDSAEGWVFYFPSPLLQIVLLVCVLADPGILHYIDSGFLCGYYHNT